MPSRIMDFLICVGIVFVLVAMGHSLEIAIPAGVIALIACSIADWFVG